MVDNNDLSTRLSELDKRLNAAQQRHAQNKPILMSKKPAPPLPKFTSPFLFDEEAQQALEAKLNKIREEEDAQYQQTIDTMQAMGTASPKKENIKETNKMEIEQEEVKSEQESSPPTDETTNDLTEKSLDELKTIIGARQNTFDEAKAESDKLTKLLKSNSNLKIGFKQSDIDKEIKEIKEDKKTTVKDLNAQLMDITAKLKSEEAKAGNGAKAKWDNVKHIHWSQKQKDDYKKLLDKTIAEHTSKKAELEEKIETDSKAFDEKIKIKNQLLDDIKNGTIKQRLEVLKNAEKTAKENLKEAQFIHDQKEKLENAKTWNLSDLTNIVPFKDWLTKSSSSTSSMFASETGKRAALGATGVAAAIGAGVALTSPTGKAALSFLIPPAAIGAGLYAAHNTKWGKPFTSIMGKVAFYGLATSALTPFLGPFAMPVTSFIIGAGHSIYKQIKAGDGIGFKGVIKASFAGIFAAGISMATAGMLGTEHGDTYYETIKQALPTEVSSVFDSALDSGKEKLSFLAQNDYTKGWLNPFTPVYEFSESISDWWDGSGAHASVPNVASQLTPPIQSSAIGNITPLLEEITSNDGLEDVKTYTDTSQPPTTASVTETATVTDEKSTPKEIISSETPQQPETTAEPTTSYDELVRNGVETPDVEPGSDGFILTPSDPPEINWGEDTEELTNKFTDNSSCANDTLSAHAGGLEINGTCNGEPLKVIDSGPNIERPVIEDKLTPDPEFPHDEEYTEGDDIGSPETPIPDHEPPTPAPREDIPPILGINDVVTAEQMPDLSPLLDKAALTDTNPIQSLLEASGTYGASAENIDYLKDIVEKLGSGEVDFLQSQQSAEVIQTYTTQIESALADDGMVSKEEMEVILNETIDKMREVEGFVDDIKGQIDDNIRPDNAENIVDNLRKSMAKIAVPS